MKITYQSHPVLRFLTAGLMAFKLYDSDKEGYRMRGGVETFDNVFDDNKSAFAQNVQIVLPGAWKTVETFHRDAVSTIPEEASGTFVMRKNIFCYNFHPKEPSFFIFFDQTLVFAQRISSVNNRSLNFHSKSVYSHIFGDSYDPYEVSRRVVRDITMAVGALGEPGLMTGYVIGANNRATVDGKKYINETGTAVTFVDLFVKNNQNDKDAIDQHNNPYKTDIGDKFSVPGMQPETEAIQPDRGIEEGRIR